MPPARVDAKDRNGQTALMWAAWQGHAEVVKALIAGGADVSVKNEDGDTALTSAESEGYTKIVKALKKAGAKE